MKAKKLITILELVDEDHEVKIDLKGKREIKTVVNDGESGEVVIEPSVYHEEK